VTRLYAGYAVFAVLALISTYFVDPYVFAFTALGMAWLSGALFVVALGIAVLSRTAKRSAKAWMIAFAATALVASVAALAVLRTFKWA